MKRYRKKVSNNVIGMLYIVEVGMTNIKTQKKTRKKLLLVGCEQSDIERKMKWIIDNSKYERVKVKHIEKVRSKVHLLSTTIVQEKVATKNVIKQGERTVEVVQGAKEKEYEPRKFAIGITTTMLAEDESSALRKTGHALVSLNSSKDKKGRATLSQDSTVTIEEVGFGSQHARARDVSNEFNYAEMVRG